MIGRGSQIGPRLRHRRLAIDTTVHYVHDYSFATVCLLAVALLAASHSFHFFGLTNEILRVGWFYLTRI